MPFTKPLWQFPVILDLATGANGDELTAANVSDGRDVQGDAGEAGPQFLDDYSRSCLDRLGPLHHCFSTYPSMACGYSAYLYGLCHAGHGQLNATRRTTIAGQVAIVPRRSISRVSYVAQGPLLAVSRHWLDLS